MLWILLVFTSASRLWGIVLSPGVKYWLSRNCSYFLTLTLKGRHCSPCCLCFQSVVHLARIPELEVCTPCDVFLRQWRLFLRQWRLFLRPWRLFLRQMATIIGQMTYLCNVTSPRRRELWTVVPNSDVLRRGRARLWS